MSEEASKELAWARRMALRYARKGPYFLHPDDVLVENVLQGLARNKRRFGKGLCPCRPVSGDPAKDRPNVCPCETHRADIERDGTCECGIFVSLGFIRQATRDRAEQHTEP